MYWKCAIAALGAGGLVLSSALSDGTVTRLEQIQIAIAVAGTILVFYVYNMPGSMYAKALVAGLAAGLNLLVGVLPDHRLTSADWWNFAVVAATAVGVLAKRNAALTPQPAQPVPPAA